MTCVLTVGAHAQFQARNVYSICPPPTRLFYAIIKEKTLTLSPTLTELTNGMAYAPKMEATAKEALLKLFMIVHLMVYFFMGV